MPRTINCFGEVKCPDGLESLTLALQKKNYQTSYRSSYGGKNHSATIQFDDANLLETRDSDGQDCLFSGEFSNQQTARQLLAQFSRDLAALEMTHRFEAYESDDELVCSVHFRWPPTNANDPALKKVNDAVQTETS